MRRYIFLIVMTIGGLLPVRAQQRDTVVVNNKVITLSEIIIRNNVNVPSFIERVKNDTTFYKAFRNLRILEFTSLNDIRMLDKKGKVKASLFSRTRQWAQKGCRHTIVEDEQVSGDIYDRKGNYNYYTPELYAGLFFASDTVCGETNIVKGMDIEVKGKSGMARRKEQLKMLFFNPGKAIPGLPFVGAKTAIFDEDMAGLYNYDLDQDLYLDELCYVFTITAKTEEEGGDKNKIVIDRMVTWFSVKTMEVLGRQYSMSYQAGLFDFDVDMQVEMTRSGDYLVPKLLRYTGDWDVVFKKRERGVFTATLFNFSN